MEFYDFFVWMYLHVNVSSLFLSKTSVEAVSLSLVWLSHHLPYYDCHVVSFPLLPSRHFTLLHPFESFLAYSPNYVVWISTYFFRLFFSYFLCGIVLFFLCNCYTRFLQRSSSIVSKCIFHFVVSFWFIYNQFKQFKLFATIVGLLPKYFTTCFFVNIAQASRKSISVVSSNWTLFHFSCVSVRQDFIV